MQFLNSSLYMYKLCVIRYESLSYHYDIQFVSILDIFTVSSEKSGIAS